MQFPDSSWLFSTIDFNVARNILIGMNFFEKGTYVFPVGSPYSVSILPILSASFGNNLFLTQSSDSSIQPLSTFDSFTNASFITGTGNTFYTLTGSNSYSDSIFLGSVNIIGTQSPTFTLFSANSLGNNPSAPVQITYSTQNATNIALTSNMRAISIPPDALSGNLTVNNPLNGEVFTLTATNTITSQTEQLTLTVNTNNKIFTCIPPNIHAVPTGLRTAFYGSGELTLNISDDDQRLYVGRAESIPALIYLGTNLIEINELANMPLSTFNFYSDGTPCIIAEDTNNVYFCQPSGGKITIFDNLTQTAIAEILGTKPTNIEVNDDFIVIKDNLKLRIFNKTYTLLSEFDLLGQFVEANDKEIFITSDKIYVLDRSTIKIINLSDVTTIAQTIDLSANYNILGGTIVVAETLSKLFIFGSDQPNLPTITTATTLITVNVNLWVYDLALDQLETVNLIQSTTRGDIRYSLRLDLDESRLFALGDWVNTVYSISTDVATNYIVNEHWNTLKPFGMAISKTGKYLYYSGQDENSITLVTQRSRHLVIMRLFETTFTITIT